MSEKLKAFSVESPLKMVLIIVTVIGHLLAALAFFQDTERAWHAYLVSYFFFACLGLGGVMFVAIQHIAAAGWSVNIRRISESLSAFLPYILFLGLPIALLATKDLYLWLDYDVVQHDALLAKKQAYLNKPFFAIRIVLFSLGWLFFGTKIVGFSLKQDQDADHNWTKKAVKWSVAFLVFFALSFSLFSVDLLMSLEPHWFSTIFGVYCFAGMFQSTLAFLILLTLHVINRGWAGHLINIEHVHDLAKFLKGFTVFWAYIAFSQFMLIWYANLPEETIFYLHRAHGGWLYVSVGLIIFRFIVPFLALLPRWAKRTQSHLIPVCLLVLVMQYVDLYWLVYPNYSHEHLAFSWIEMGMFAAMAGLFLLSVTQFLGKHSIVPCNDPYKDESADHHVTY